MCVSHDSKGIIFCSLGEAEAIYVGKNRVIAIARSSRRKKRLLNPISRGLYEEVEDKHSDSTAKNITAFLYRVRRSS